MPTLYEIATSLKNNQQTVVDAITCEAPILRDLPMEESSHGLWNIYESMNGVTGGDIVEQDAKLPTVGVESELKQTDLSIIGGEMEVGEDTARKLGGPAAYFARKATPVLRKTGMSAEHRILYTGFRERQRAGGVRKVPRQHSGRGDGGRHGDPERHQLHGNVQG